MVQLDGSSGLSQLSWSLRATGATWSKMASLKVCQEDGNDLVTCVTTQKVVPDPSHGAWSQGPNEDQAYKDQLINAFELSFYIMFTNVPLAKVSHVAKVRFRGWDTDHLLLRIATKWHCKGTHIQGWQECVAIFMRHHSEENLVSLSSLKKSSKYIDHGDLPFEHPSGISNSKGFISKGKQILIVLKHLNLLACLR